MSEDMEATDMLVVGSPDGNPGLVAARRSDDNREFVDAAVLPPTLAIDSTDDDMPQHPAVLIRTYENVQMVMNPEMLRWIGNWMLQSADWLQDMIDQAQ